MELERKLSGCIEAKNAGVPQDLIELAGDHSPVYDLTPPYILMLVRERVDESYDDMNDNGDPPRIALLNIRRVDYYLGIAEWKLGRPICILPESPTEYDLALLCMTTWVPKMVSQWIRSVFCEYRTLPRLSRRVVRLLSVEEQLELISLILDQAAPRVSLPLGSIGALSVLHWLPRGPEVTAKFCAHFPQLIGQVADALSVHPDELIGPAVKFRLVSDG